ncbi:hypothetical protein QZH41_011055 [Actinostola sp. cb2023]|nr:hypothetical protein QZH41_011055 [Actinostola sp. cb2023]
MFTFSDSYPEITYFPPTDLVSAGDINEGTDVNLPCKAKGKQPLTYRWRFSKGTSSKHFKMDDDGSLIGRNLKPQRAKQLLQCVVSNEYGTVFSTLREIDVTAVTTPFKAGPSSRPSKLFFSYGHPLIVPSPPHEVHLGANYTWGTVDKLDGRFLPLKESKHHGITARGSLVFSFIKISDIRKTLHCRVSVGLMHYVSRGYGFSAGRSSCGPDNHYLTHILFNHDIVTRYGSHFALPPALVEKPQVYEMASRGTTKIMRCVPTGNPTPDIIWWKDGALIYSGKNDMKLESYNRILVIKNINEKTHPGKYQCGYGSHVSTRRVLATTTLHVTGPPVVTKRLPKALTVEAKHNFTLQCKAKQMFSAYQDDLHYHWYKDEKRIESARNRTVEKNTLTIMNTRSEDSGVYQCVAYDRQGMTTASTRVHVNVKKCPAIPPPLHSKFTEGSCQVHSAFLSGSRCTVLCDRGFFGKGRRNYRKCMEDGGWSVMQYICEARTQIVSKPPSLIYALRGQTLSLGCIAKSYPIKPLYTWKKSTYTDNDHSIVIKTSSNIQLLNGGEKLVISHVSDKDSGKYVCEAVNTYYNAPGIRDTAVVSVEVVKEVQWSPWQPWTACDVRKCGNGLQTRKRTCLKNRTFFSRKKKVHFADADTVPSKENDDKVKQEESSKESSPTYENVPASTPIYENTQTMPIYENTPLEGQNAPQYENTGTEVHYENVGSFDGQYENTDYQYDQGGYDYEDHEIVIGPLLELMIPPTINITAVPGTKETKYFTNVIATHITKRASETDLNGIRCHLNDEFGLFIQGILAFVAFSTLLLKRYKEPPAERRTFTIWFYDTSKQAVGAVLMHFANVVLAGQFSGDPCTWYFINFLLDSTLGLVFIWICLRLTQFIVNVYSIESLRSGVYGTPPQCCAWVGQCVLYLVIVVFEKTTVALLVQLHFWEEVRQFILKPVRGNPKMELAIVMLIVPFLFNALMFWVVDGFLMRKRRKSLETEDHVPRVKYHRRENPKSSSQSDEEAVLLDNEGDAEDGVFHREIIR